MKNLLIRFIDKKIRKYKGLEYVRGEIIINDFTENFDSPLDLWSIGDYERQWCKGLERIKTHDTSCLIVSICDPKQKRKHLSWWLLYKKLDSIVIRNEVYYGEFYEEYFDNKEINTENCYNFIPPLFTEDICDEEGFSVSEWIVSLKD